MVATVWWSVGQTHAAAPLTGWAVRPRPWVGQTGHTVQTSSITWSRTFSVSSQIASGALIDNIAEEVELARLTH